MSPAQNNETVVRTVCNSHCGGTCEIKVHVRDGRIVRIENGDSADGQPRACLRGRAYRQRVYAPDRLLYPLKRTGARGSGQFTQISWDEALETAANEMKRVKDTCGNAAILHFCSMADAFTLHHVRAIHRLLCLFGGYTAPWGTISNEGYNFAAGVTYGNTYILKHLPQDYPKARLIILWSANPATTAMGTTAAWNLAAAREAGARVICVDPRYTDTAAAFADEWAPIRPGTDAAVLAAMAYVIVSEDRHDPRFIDTYTVGFDQFRDYLLGKEDGVKKTPDWAEAISGVPAATITRLAREYAGTKPALLITGNAAGRTAFGEQYHRMLSTLEAITGNSPGTEKGSLSSEPPVFRALASAVQMPSPPNPVEQGKPLRWNALPYRGSSVNSSARVCVNLLSDAILKGKAGGYPADYKFLWMAYNNYLNQLAEVNKAVKAFQRLEFVLVTEQFMTATARFADIVLPTCTYLERNDFYVASGGDAYGLVSKAIEPLGESKSMLQICEALAARLGIHDYNSKSDEEWARSMVAKLARETDFPDYNTLKQEGIHRLRIDKTTASSTKVPEKAEIKLFPTPSGKFEIYSQTAAKMNHPRIPPIPEYVETWESPNDPLARKYPLQLITPHFKRRAHSQFDNLPWLRELEPQALSINSADANLRGIRDGDTVRLFNDRGEVLIPARVTERIMPGVVALPQGAWYSPDENGTDHGGCANVLTKNVTSPAGAFASNTALVQVEKAKAQA